MNRVPMLFKLIVNGKAADARRLECHFQGVPYPGGCRYVLTVADVETVAYTKEVFGSGTHRLLAAHECRRLLSFLGGIKQIRIGREDPPQFWVNTVDGLHVADNEIVLEGVCSYHVD